MLDKNNAFRLFLALFAGGVMGFGQAPHDIWLAGFLGCLAGFLLLPAPPRTAFLLGGALGLGYFGTTLFWVTEPFAVDAATTGWMAPFALVGMAGGLCLFWAFAFALASWSGRGGLALVIFWSAAELARAYLFTGFPWALLSYIWLDTPIIQLVSLIGPHGLTFVTLSVMGLLAAGTLWRMLTGGALLALLFALGIWITPPAQEMTDRPIIRLVQPNAPQHEKWDPAMTPVFLDRQVGFTAAPAQAGRTPSLVIWPETSVPVLLNQAGPAFERISAVSGGAPVALGIQREEAGRFYNSLVIVSPDGETRAIYDKHHLVPFGEYMPVPDLWQQLGIASLAARAGGGYTSGPGSRLIDLADLGRTLPLICYEAVFPQDLHMNARADFLIQITNDAWFGENAGPKQHFAQARIRAIEQGLPMLRAANTGISAVIDGAGRVNARLPLGEAGYLDAPLPPPLSSTVYAKTGDFPIMLINLLAITMLFMIRRREFG